MRPAMRSVLLRIFCGLIVFVTLTLASIALGFYWWLHKPLPLSKVNVELSIERGTNPQEVAKAWVEAGVQTSPWLLYQWFRWSGQAKKFLAGNYEIDERITPQGLLAKMVRGDQSMVFVRLPEGQTLQQWRAELAKAPSLKNTIQGLSDTQILKALGEPEAWPEGQFFPDTYNYTKGSPDLAVLRRARRAMQQHLAKAWAQRDPQVPLRNASELLVLASIVEKETGKAAERAMIAGVFVNRLRINMPLQTDPTVIYGLGSAFDGNLRKHDLQTDTPYNTYTRKGLPPTPITMPSKASLEAAARPATTKALYFVAKGDGSSVFSETLQEHNRAVDRYQRNR